MLALTKPGQLIVDLGAHVGQFSLTAVAAKRRVLAVEASSRNHALLQAAVAANGFSGLELIRAAVSNSTGELRFNEAGPYGFVSGEIDPRANIVPAIRMGERLASQSAPICFIKMDVEGHEIEAVEGMADWLRDYPGNPPILYESNLFTFQQRGREPSHLRNLLKQLGYQHHYLVTDSHLLHCSERNPQPMVVADYLATKTPLMAPRGWRVDETPAARLVEQLLPADVMLHWDSPDALACLGRVWQQCDSPLIRESRVVLYFGYVAHHHPHPDVQRAFMPWAKAWTTRAWSYERLRVMPMRLFSKLNSVLKLKRVRRAVRSWRNAA